MKNLNLTIDEIDEININIDEIIDNIDYDNDNFYNYFDSFRSFYNYNDDKNEVDESGFIYPSELDYCIATNTIIYLVDNDLLTVKNIITLEKSNYINQYALYWKLIELHSSIPNNEVKNFIIKKNNEIEEARKEIKEIYKLKTDRFGGKRENGYEEYLYEMDFEDLNEIFGFHFAINFSLYHYIYCWIEGHDGHISMSILLDNLDKLSDEQITYLKDRIYYINLNKKGYFTKNLIKFFEIFYNSKNRYYLRELLSYFKKEINTALNDIYKYKENFKHEIEFLEELKAKGYKFFCIKQENKSDTWKITFPNGLILDNEEKETFFFQV